MGSLAYLVRGYQKPKVWWVNSSVGTVAAGSILYGVKKLAIDPALGVYIDENGKKASYNIASAPNLFGENPLTYYIPNKETGKFEKFQSPSRGDWPYLLTTGALLLGALNTARVYNNTYEKLAFSKNAFQEAWAKVKEPFTLNYKRALLAGNTGLREALLFQLKTTGVGAGIILLNKASIREAIGLNTSGWDKAFNIAGSILIARGLLDSALTKIIGRYPKTYSVVKTIAVDHGLRGTAGTLFFVIAPLHIAVEGTSAIFKKYVVPSSNTWLERDFLNSTFAAFWDEKTAGIKYQGAWDPQNKGYVTSAWDIFKVGYKAGLLGVYTPQDFIAKKEKEVGRPLNNEEIGVLLSQPDVKALMGTLKVKSLRELNSPASLAKALYNADGGTNIWFSFILAIGHQPLSELLSNIKKGDFGRKFKAVGEGLEHSAGLGIVGLEQTSKGAGDSLAKSLIDRNLDLVVKGTVEEVIIEQAIERASAPVFGLLQAIAPTGFSQYIPLLSEIWQEVASPGGAGIRSNSRELQKQINAVNGTGINLNIQVYKNGSASPLISNSDNFVVNNDGILSRLATLNNNDKVVLITPDGLKRVFEVDNAAEWSRTFNIQARAIELEREDIVHVGKIAQGEAGHSAIEVAAANKVIADYIVKSPEAAQIISKVVDPQNNGTVSISLNNGQAPLAIKTRNLYPYLIEQVAYSSEAVTSRADLKSEIIANVLKAIAKTGNLKIDSVKEKLSEAQADKFITSIEAVTDESNNVYVDELSRKIFNLQNELVWQEGLAKYNANLKNPYNILNFAHNRKELKRIESVIIKEKQTNIEQRLVELERIYAAERKYLESMKPEDIIKKYQENEQLVREMLKNAGVEKNIGNKSAIDLEQIRKEWLTAEEGSYKEEKAELEKIKSGTIKIDLAQEFKMQAVTNMFARENSVSQETGNKQGEKVLSAEIVVERPASEIKPELAQKEITDAEFTEPTKNAQQPAPEAAKQEENNKKKDGPTLHAFVFGLDLLFNLATWRKIGQGFGIVAKAIGGFGKGLLGGKINDKQKKKEAVPPAEKAIPAQTPVTVGSVVGSVSKNTHTPSPADANLAKHSIKLTGFGILFGLPIQLSSKVDPSIHTGLAPPYANIENILLLSGMLLATAVVILVSVGSRNKGTKGAQSASSRDGERGQGAESASSNIGKWLNRAIAKLGAAVKAGRRVTDTAKQNTTITGGWASASIKINPLERLIRRTFVIPQEKNLELIHPSLRNFLESLKGENITLLGRG
ncbi:MAG: hypothetical protein WC357_04980 [Candidatus Omnitrophota bacterium]